jgi:hypothetical protein
MTKCEGGICARSRTPLSPISILARADEVIE